MGAWLCKHETALPTQFLETIRPQFSSSGTHRINTCSNVTVPDVSVFHHKESIVFQLGAWYVSMRLLSPHNSFEDHPSSSCAALALTESITCSNVTVRDVSVFHHKESIVFQLGAWLCKHETALPHTIHLETICPSCAALALTESIHVVMSLYLMSVYSITRSQLCFNWVLDYVSMRLLSPTQFIWRHPSPSSPALALTESIHVSNVTVPACQCIPSQGVNCVSIGCLIM